MQNYRAVMCLIALTGNYDIPGGNPSRPGPVSPCNEYGKVKRLDTIEAIGEKDFPAWFDLPCEEAQCTRIADYILKDRDDVLNVFIHGNMPEKIQRITLLYNVEEKEAVKMMADIDKRRMTNYNFYTDQKWGKASNYTLCLNSSQLGYDRCEAIIMECVK